jgi:hypothetical protein
MLKVAYVETVSARVCPRTAPARRLPWRPHRRASRGPHAAQDRTTSLGRQRPETPGSFPRAVPRPGARRTAKRSVRGSPLPCAVLRWHLRRHPIVISDHIPLFKVVHPPSVCSTPPPLLPAPPRHHGRHC